jgi:hypothetical protein
MRLSGEKSLHNLPRNPNEQTLVIIRAFSSSFFGVGPGRDRKSSQIYRSHWLKIVTVKRDLGKEESDCRLHCSNISQSYAYHTPPSRI